MSLVSFYGVAARYTDELTGECLIPESTVRGWADENRDGFAERCVIRLPGKRLVDLEAMEAWLEDRRGPQPIEEPPDEGKVIRLRSRSRLPDFEESWGQAESR